MNAKEAFQTIQGIGNKELQKAEREGPEMFGRGNTTGARNAIDQVKKLQKLITAIQELQDQW